MKIKLLIANIVAIGICDLSITGCDGFSFLLPN